MLIARRPLLAGLAAAAGLAWARRVPPSLAEAARREGAVVLFTSMDLAVAGTIADGFRAGFPDIDLHIERSGSARIFAHLEHNFKNGLPHADVVESSHLASFSDWKARGWLAPFVPEDVSRHWPAAERDPDGCFASVRAQLSVLAYNTALVRKDEAPCGYSDLLHPRWRGRLVKSHPGYSGTTLAATHAIAENLGWSFFEDLARQDVLHVQCSTETARMVAQGLRAVMVDGSEAVAAISRRDDLAIEIVYPIEGTPKVSAQAGVMKRAPHPNAARLLAGYLFSRSCQSVLVHGGGLRSFHPEVAPMAGMPRLDQIRLLRADASALSTQGAFDTKTPATAGRLN